MFTIMIVCRNCGKKYQRKTKRDEACQKRSTISIWEKGYDSKQNPEGILMVEMAAILSESEFDEWLFKVLI